MSENSLSPIMPRRKKRTTIMMMTEKTTSRNPLRRKGTLKPFSRMISLSRKRSHHSLQGTKRNEARQLPVTEPMPPMTTMSRIS